MNTLTLTPFEKQQLNKLGDKLAEMLKMREEPIGISPDKMGNRRWQTRDGNKTGAGLMLTVERFFGEIAVAKEDALEDGPRSGDDVDLYADNKDSYVATDGKVVDHDKE